MPAWEDFSALIDEPSADLDLIALPQPEVSSQGHVVPNFVTNANPGRTTNVAHSMVPPGGSNSRSRDASSQDHDQCREPGATQPTLDFPSRSNAHGP